MVKLVHTSLMVIVVGVSLGLSIYCFRLLSKFFKGSIFKGSIKIIGAFAILFAGGAALDIIADVFETESFALHVFHIVIEIMFVVSILYGVRRLYLAWTKLGSR